MEVADNEKDIQDFSRMLKKAYSSQVRKHFPDIGFFRLLAWQNPEKELAKVFLVKYKGKIIGGSICLFSKESAYLWFSGGMRKTYAFLYPGILAVWAPITYARRKRICTFGIHGCRITVQKARLQGLYTPLWRQAEQYTPLVPLQLEVAEQTLVQILYLIHFCLFV